HDIGKPRCKSEDDNGVHFYGHDVEGERMTIEIMRRLKFPNYEIDRISTLVRWHMFYYPSSDYRTENPGYADEINKISGDDSNFKSWKDFIKNQISKITRRKTKKEFGWSDGAVRRLIKN